MWCQHCRQDVPALASGDRPGFCCPRCSQPVWSGASVQPSGDRIPDYDSWEVDEELRHIGRLLQSAPAEKEGRQFRPGGLTRFDGPHGDGEVHHRPANWLRRPEIVRRHSRGVVVGTLTWLILSLGTMSLMCGGSLLVWSLMAGRQELWSVGLPIALIGQIALLSGLVLQIDRLWHSNRDAAAKLDDVDEQIHELKAATTLLGTGQGAGGSTFYSHFAGGAAPQLLLRDLLTFAQRMNRGRPTEGR